MSIAKPIQLVWAMLLFLLMGARAFGSGSVFGIALGAILIVYLISTVGCLANFRVAWLVAFFVPVLILMRWVPMVCINCFMFFTGHELYQDSPATILVVVIYAVAFVAPPLVIYSLLFLDRERVRALLFPHKRIGRSGSNSNSDLNQPFAPTGDNPYSPPQRST
jgi:hypothetical protein